MGHTSFSKTMKIKEGYFKYMEFSSHFLLSFAFWVVILIPALKLLV